MSDSKHTQETADSDETPLGGTTEDTEEILEEETTDENGKPLENPSGG